MNRKLIFEIKEGDPVKDGIYFFLFYIYSPDSLHLPAIIYMELREIGLTHQNHTNCPEKNKEEYMSSYEYTQLYAQILIDVRFSGNKVLEHARNVRFHRTCELFSCYW